MKKIIILLCLFSLTAMAKPTEQEALEVKNSLQNFIKFEQTGIHGMAIADCETETGESSDPFGQYHPNELEPCIHLYIFPGASSHAEILFPKLTRVGVHNVLVSYTLDYPFAPFPGVGVGTEVPPNPQP